MTVDDLRKPEAWFKKQNGRTLTAADKSRSRHRAATAPVVQRASHVYSIHKPKHAKERKGSDALSQGKSAGTLPPSVDLKEPLRQQLLQQDSLLDGDSEVLNARSGILPKQRPHSFLHDPALGQSLNQSISNSMGAISYEASTVDKSASKPGRSNGRTGPANFATSSLAFSGNGGMQLAGLSGMFGVATMSDLTRHDPREAGQAAAAGLTAHAPAEFIGAVTNANRKEVIKTFFKEDIPAPIKAQINSQMPLGVAPRDPYMGAGSAAGYGIGHETRLAQRSAVSYGRNLSQRKVAGEEIWMFEEDEAERQETGWDPAEVGKARMSETFLQTGTGLKQFKFRGSKASDQRVLAQAMSAPITRARSQDSLVAPAITAAHSQRIGASGATTNAGKTLRQMIGAQLGATPLGSDPRAANFRPHASIAHSKPNAERRRKLAKQGPIKGPLQKQKGPTSAYDIPQVATQPERPPMKEYDAGGRRGLGAGMGTGAVQVPFKLKDSTTADGTLLTSERLHEIVQAFETGSEIQRLRKELEEARSSMQNSQNILQASARDWRQEQAKETQQLIGMDLTSLSRQVGHAHSRFPGSGK